MRRTRVKTLPEAIVTHPSQFDRQQAEIVRRLQEDGRVSFEALAKAVGTSRTTASLRVQELIDSGGIRVTAVAHPEATGQKTSAHLSITTSGSARDVALRIAARDEAVYVSLTSGRASIMAEVRTTDIGALHRCTAQIRGEPGVTGVRPLIVSENYIDPYLRGSPMGEVTLESTDYRIIAELIVDGRLPFAILARRLDLSPSAVRSRTIRLLDSRAVRIVTLVRPEILGRGYPCGFAVKFHGPSADTARSIAQLEAVTFLSACVGRADLIGTVSANSTTAVVSALELIRRVSGVGDVESWSHLETVREKYPTPSIVQSGPSNE